MRVFPGCSWQDWMRVEKRGGVVKEGTQVFGLSNCQDGLFTYCGRGSRERTVCGRA